MNVREQQLVLWLVDLAGFTQMTRHRDHLAVARFLDGFYRGCAKHVRQHGGRVVKFMGDACFAVFDESHLGQAVDCAAAAVSVDPGEGLAFGVRVHVAKVAAGEIGPPDLARFDVFGAGVNALFGLPSASGVVISSAAYDGLSQAQRQGWKPGGAAGVYVPASP